MEPVQSTFVCDSVAALCAMSAVGAAARDRLRTFLLTELHFSCSVGGSEDTGSTSGDAVPAWLSPVGGGITNGLVCVRSLNAPPLLVRIFGEGTERLIDRAQDTNVCAYLGNLGLAPRVFAVFANGRVEAFLAGVRALEPLEMRARALVPTGGAAGDAPVDVLAELATAVARFHALPSPPGASKSPVLWRRLTGFADLAQAAYPVALRSAPQFTVHWTAVRSELAWLETVLPSPQNGEGSALIAAAPPAAAASMQVIFASVFAHNDLLSGNVLLDKRSLMLIDFEYADTNYAGYDLANNICEHTGFDCNWDRDFPSADVRRELVAQYAKAAAVARGATPPTAADVMSMAAWVDRYCLASHFWWGLWALVQAAHSQIDFPFEAYFPRRMDGYARHKAEFMGATAPPLYTLSHP